MTQAVRADDPARQLWPDGLRRRPTSSPRTLLDLPPDQLTQQGVNAAIRNIKNFKTDILCQPWYFGDLPYHVPNNVDRTVVPQEQRMVQKEDCFPIAALPDNNLDSDPRRREQAQLA